MAMPWPKPVEPSFSRRSKVSRMPRGSSLVRRPAWVASSCSSCFLFAALRFGTTPSRRRISLSCMESSCPSRIDPAYMAIVTAIHQIESGADPVSEQNEGQVGDFELQDGFSNRKLGDVGRGLGNDGRREAFQLGGFLSTAGDHIAGGSEGPDGLGARLLMIPQSLLVPLQLMLEMGCRLVEARMGVGAPAVGLKGEPGRQVEGAFAVEKAALLLDDDLGLDRTVEQPSDPGRNPLLDAATQRLTHV